MGEDEYKDNEKVLCKGKVMLSRSGKEPIEVDCFVTWGHVVIEAEEPIKIPVSQIQGWDEYTDLPTLLTQAQRLRATATLRFLDDQDKERKLLLEMAASDIASFSGALREQRIPQYRGGDLLGIAGNFVHRMVAKVPLLRVIWGAVRDKAADNLCARLLSLGIGAQVLGQYPLRWARFERFEEGGTSLGLIQVGLKNIRYVNVIRFRTQESQDEERLWYQFEYLIPLASIPWSLSVKTQLRLGKRHRFLDENEVMGLEDKVVGWQWEGGPLANVLNSDSSLNSNLSTELRLDDGPFGNIEIVSEPVYGCVRIITEAGSKVTSLFVLVSGLFKQRESIPRLPVRSSIDCLDRIAEHVTKVAES